MENKASKQMLTAMTVVGSLFGLWALATLVGGLRSVNWQVTELARQYLIATGMLEPLHTVVDFYTHIKGIEYIICVAFFVAFPLFFQYVEKRKTTITTPPGRGNLL